MKRSGFGMGLLAIALILSVLYVLGRVPDDLRSIESNPDEIWVDYYPDTNGWSQIREVDNIDPITATRNLRARHIYISPRLAVSGPGSSCVYVAPMMTDTATGPWAIRSVHVLNPMQTFWRWITTGGRMYSAARR